MLLLFSEITCDSENKCVPWCVSLPGASFTDVQFIQGRLCPSQQGLRLDLMLVCHVLEFLMLSEEEGPHFHFAVGSANVGHPDAKLPLQFSWFFQPRGPELVLGPSLSSQVWRSENPLKLLRAHCAFCTAPSRP